MATDYLIDGFWISVFKPQLYWVAKPAEPSIYSYDLNVITSGIKATTVESLDKKLRERIKILAR